MRENGPRGEPPGLTITEEGEMAKTKELRVTMLDGLAAARWLFGCLVLGALDEASSMRAVLREEGWTLEQDGSTGWWVTSAGRRIGYGATPTEAIRSARFPDGVAR